MTPKALTNINPLAGVAGLVVTAAVLVAAISFTQQGEFPWVAFLSGLLFAAVLAFVYRFTNTNRIIAALRHDLRRFDDDFPLMVAYAGTDEVIRWHNRAFRDWLRVRRELVNGHQLREVMGSTTYQQFKPAIDQALKGRFVQEKRVHTDSERRLHLHVQNIPRTNDKGQVVGFFLTLIDVSRYGRSSDTRTLPAQPALATPAPSRRPATTPAANAHSFAEKTMMVAPAGRDRPAPAPKPSPAPPPALAPARPAPPPRRVAPPKVTAGVPDLVLATAAAVMDLEVQSGPVVPDFVTPAPARPPRPWNRPAASARRS